MSEGQQFYLVLTLIYLLDCLHWAPRHAVAYLSLGLGPFAQKRPSPWAGNNQSGLLMAMPLPPLGQYYLASPWPVAITERGVSSPGLDHPNPGGLIRRPVWFLAWDQIEKVAYEGRTLILNENTRIHCSSAWEALGLRDFIHSLRSQNPDQRRETISRKLRTSLSPSLAKHRLRSFQCRTRILRILSNLLFCYTFVGVPLAYLTFGESRPFFLVLAILWILMWQIGIEFFFLHRRWFRELKMERWQHFVSCILLPPNAMRMHDALSAHYFRDQHPLALANLLLPAEGYQEKASAMLRDLEFPLQPTLHGEAETVAHEHSQEFHEHSLLPEIEHFVGTAPAEVPEPEEKYCPRCHATFESEASHCQDCTGLGLREVTQRKGSTAPVR